MTTIAVVAASGLGKRMKLKPGQSKQYLKIGRYPVIYYTLKAFEQSKEVDQVIVATLEEYFPYLKRLAKRHGFSKVQHIIQGGKERQDSIYNCLSFLSNTSSNMNELNNATILIHDGVRPFILPHEIDEIAKLTKAFGATVPATKPKDTIKTIGSSEDVFGKTLDRSELRQVQTPQAFTFKLIFDAHQKAKEAGVYATDDGALLEKYFPEHPIKIYDMGYHNIKITTPEDIDLGKMMVKRLGLG